MVDDYTTRDLPDGIDLEDVDGVFAAHFDYLRMTDDTNEFGRVLQEYSRVGPEIREVINNLFISLCGYSLPTLVERAHQNV